MSSSTVLLCLIAALSVNTVTVYGLTRTVKTQSWPNCDDFPKACSQVKAMEGMNLVYSKATHSSNDNLYYAFSTAGAPSVVLVHTTGKDRDMFFNYTAIALRLPLTKAVSFQGSKEGWTLEYKFGVAFTKLIEYDDQNDTANIETCDKNHGNFSITDLGDHSWFLEDVQDNSFTFKAMVGGGANSSSGNISFAFSVKADDGRNEKLPRMVYNSNVTQFDFEIAGVPPTFDSSRFAVEAMLVSLSSNSDMTTEQHSTIDDEYAPGVFLITDWLSNPKRKSASGFMQWKPVAYIAEDRDRKVATKVTHYDMDTRTDKDILQDTFVYALFGDDLWDATKVIHRATNISFGLAKDGFYVKNNYTVWSAAVGYGTPPEDSISTTVIIIIAVGLGLPVVMIVFGGAYTCTKKCRKQPDHDYQPIGDGDISRTNPQVN